MQVKDQFFGSWALYLTFGTRYEVNIMQLRSFSIHKENMYTLLRLSDYALCMRSVNSRAWDISKV